MFGDSTKTFIVRGLMMGDRSRHVQLQLRLQWAPAYGQMTNVVEYCI
jgi:hypothetical protein